MAAVIRARTITEYWAVCDKCNHSGPKASNERDAIGLARDEGWSIVHKHTCDDGTCYYTVLCGDCVERLAEQLEPSEAEIIDALDFGKTADQHLR